ncbi:MAG: ribosomal-processing cysteine protease Prp [Tissierellia bacterium]|nr:ribosomal-processing cysteine protease Prp [Tissierellia bacterium]
MINISLLKRGEKFCGFSIRGHAGYADKGEDIICAAVSILSHTLYRSLLHSLSFEEKEVIASQEDGTMDMWIDGPLDDRTELLFSFFLEGIQSLVDEYGDYVMYEIKEEHHA